MAAEQPSQDAIDVLSAIYEAGEQVRERELQTALTKLDDLDEQDRAVVEALAARLVDSVLAPPTQSLLTAAAGTEPQTALALFGDDWVDTDSARDRPAEPPTPGVARAQD